MKRRRLHHLPVKHLKLVKPPCEHAKVMPNYDDKDFDGLDEFEIRRRFPRFHGECPDCGARLIRVLRIAFWLHATSMHPPRRLRRRSRSRALQRVRSSRTSKL